VELSTPPLMATATMLGVVVALVGRPSICGVAVILSFFRDT